MSNKRLKLSQAALPKCGQGKKPLQEQSISIPVDLQEQEMARKVKGFIFSRFPPVKAAKAPQ